MAIVKKELRAALRDKTGWALLVSIPVFLLIMLGFIGTTASEYQTSRGAAQIGRSLLEAGVYAQVILLMIALPPFAALGLTREKEGRTLDALQVVPRSPVQLLAGKWLAPALLGLLSVLLSLPVLMALEFVGGVCFWEPLRIALVLVPVALVASAAGLAVGAAVQNSAGAALLAGMLSAFGAAATSWPMHTGAGTLLAAALPVGAVRRLLSWEEVTGFGLPVPGVLPALLFQGLVAALFFVLALPALSNTYRRRALPARRLLAAVGVTAYVFVAGTMPLHASDSSWREVTAALFLSAALLTPILLTLEQLDTAGFLCTLPGSAEAAELAAGGRSARFEASRAALVLILPLAATLGAICLVANAWYNLDSIFYLRLQVGASAALVLSWSLLCLGSSRLLPEQRKGWLPAIAALLAPAGLCILGCVNRVHGWSSAIDWFFAPGVLLDLQKMGPLVASEQSARFSWFGANPDLMHLGQAAVTVLVTGGLGLLLLFVARRLDARRATAKP